MATSSVIDFYDPDTAAPFDRRRSNTTLERFLNSWSNGELESKHDYIQHLFPLPERSPVNPDAPIITKAMRDAFATRPELRESMRKAFGRMLRFYGFEMLNAGEEMNCSIKPASNFNDRAEESWLTTMDHNHLRISRIIRCLRILGLEKEALAFRAALISANEEAGGVVSASSKKFWERAATWELSKPPSWPREPEVEWLKK